MPPSTQCRLRRFYSAISAAFFLGFLFHAQATELVQIGGQTGAQIFFDSGRSRTFNFGVTSQGVGLELYEVDLYLKRSTNATLPVVINLYDNFGGTGNVLASSTISASAVSSSSFSVAAVFLSSTITLRAGAYSIQMTTGGTEDFFFKEGLLSLSGSSGILPMTQWVQDNNTQGNASTTLSTTSNVLADYSLSGTSHNFGSYRIGSTLNQDFRVTNSSFYTSNNVTESLVVSSSTSAQAGISGLTTSPIAVTNYDDFTLSLNSSAVGINSGTINLSFASVKGTSNSTSTGTTSIASKEIVLTGTGFRTATASFSSTNASLGKFHVGATNLTGTITVANTATADGLSEGLVLSGSTGAGATVGTVTGLIASGSTRSVVVGLSSVGSVGSNSGTVLFGLTSSGQGTSGLADLSLGSQQVNISAQGYSGQASWNTNASGSWGSFDSWDTNGGTPGLDGALSAHDTATFSSAISGATTVRLDGANPVLAALSFSNAYASYTITTGSSGGLTLGTGSSTGTITNTAGSHSISTSLMLARTTTVNSGSGTLLTISGAISGTGALSKIGSGKLVLTGSNDYSGGTLVSDGALVINGTTSGTVSVAAGATLAGSGVITGDTTISGFHAPGNSPGLETFTQNLAYENGSALDWELAANTIAGRGTNYDGVDVLGNLTISQGAKLNLAFNGTGSTVDFSDAFWASDHEWLVLSVAGVTTGNFALADVSADSLGASLGSLRPSSAFSIYSVDDNVLVKYSATVPEPSVSFLGCIGLLCLVSSRKRRH